VRAARLKRDRAYYRCSTHGGARGSVIFTLFRSVLPSHLPPSAVQSLASSCLPSSSPGFRIQVTPVPAPWPAALSLWVAVHSMQVAIPVTFAYLPAPHIPLSVWPVAAWCLPFAQSEQLVLPRSGCTFLVEHLMHDVCLVLDVYLPRGHSSHALMPALSPCLPAAQALQEVCSSFECLPLRGDNTRKQTC
jgi:hypothetical protein